MMKKLLSFLLLFLCPLLFLGCSGNNNSQVEELSRWARGCDQIKVLSTTGMIGDVVREIGGDRISHLTLIRGDVDPHSYELVKGDDEKFLLADLVFSTGLCLEHGASLRQWIKKHCNSVSVGDVVQAKYPGRILVEEGQIDPHIWMDVSLWKEIIDPIVAALSKIDPDNSLFYKKNGERLFVEMENVDIELRALFETVHPSKRYLVTSHDAFNYFTRRYLSEPGELYNEVWRKRFVAPEGLSPDGQLSCLDIEFVANFLIEHNLHVIFPETNINRDALNKIVDTCRQKHHLVALSKQPLYGDAMGPQIRDGVLCRYLHVMKKNGITIVEEWRESDGTKN